MKSVSILLKGGLGNQLFQYAAAKGIADFYNCDLYIDTKTGFLFDYKFKRNIEIDKLNTNFKKSNLLKSLPIWIVGNLIGKYFKSKKKNFTKIKLWKIFYFKEKENIFYEKIFSFKNVEHLYLDGYFQSPKYFHRIYKQISFQLLPKVPKEKKFCRIASQMQEENSIAVCIRLYEETKDPRVYSRSGRIQNLKKINNVLNKFINNEKDPKFYVFCTKNYDCLNKLNLPKDTKFLTEENGFYGALNNLWLMANCKHHIITNSSFYWWGAWLSPYISENKKKFVYISDEFLNLDCKPDIWNYF